MEPGLKGRSHSRARNLNRCAHPLHFKMLRQPPSRGCQEHATPGTSVLPLDSEHSKAVTAIRLEGGSYVPRTTSSWRFGHQQGSPSTFEPPASIPQPGPARRPALPQRPGNTSRPRGGGAGPPSATAPSGGRSRPSASRFLQVPPASDLQCRGRAGPVPQVRKHSPLLPRSAPGSDAPEAPFPYGAGKEDGGAQQPVRREDTGPPESGQTRA